MILKITDINNYIKYNKNLINKKIIFYVILASLSDIKIKLNDKYNIKYQYKLFN